MMRETSILGSQFSTVKLKKETFLDKWKVKIWKVIKQITSTLLGLKPNIHTPSTSTSILLRIKILKNLFLVSRVSWDQKSMIPMCVGWSKCFSLIKIRGTFLVSFNIYSMKRQVERHISVDKTPQSKIFLILSIWHLNWNRRKYQKTKTKTTTTKAYLNRWEWEIKHQEYSIVF